MDFKIAVLAGDGIGPEISVQGVEVMSLREVWSQSKLRICNLWRECH